MNSEYPSQKDLKYIKNYDLVKNGIVGLVDFICDNWHYGDWGYKKRLTSKTLWLQLHTGGWSGNESIIGAMMENRVFWMFGWQKSLRGGHYWFKWNLPKKEKIKK